METTDFKEWDSFGKIENYENLEEYFENLRTNFKKDKNTKYYSHYTSLSNIENIFSSGEIWISSTNEFNDNDEENELKNKYFSLCFCRGRGENFSLWYLYSGTQGTGGRMIFTQAKLRKILNEPVMYLCKKREDIKQGIPLILNEDYTLDFGNVLYYKKNYKHVDLKFNTMTNFHKIPYSEFEKYQKKHLGFTKNIIWYHENEMRVFITLSDEMMARFNQEEKEVIKIDISQIADAIKIQLAPEIADKEFVRKYPNISSILDENQNRVILSDYKGAIKMKLCDKCEYRCDKIKCSKRTNTENDKK